ncbi:hypothetical protein [Bradyrhizobium glycinis]|uniref:hypothetical protein n=1 Tax=Bradyrhizobium glycinis TaxID=2751812 RepID=UPI0018D93998|nr:hypothetical protein [Bradyrhizobium glycinis]MBH5371096.1 hypothetical protein [Bradyrhizobium glycinis]
MSEMFKDDNSSRTKFPGKDEITSTIDFRVTHPLAENAGDILLERQLQLDGKEPLVLSHSVNPEAKARAIALGFTEVSDSMMVLDPTKHADKWAKNGNSEWQRKGRPLHLAATQDGSASGAKPVQASENWLQEPNDDEYEFM